MRRVSDADRGLWRSRWAAIGAAIAVISYQDAFNAELKVLACGNLACSPYIRVGR